MPDHLGSDLRRVKVQEEDNIKWLQEDEVQIIQAYKTMPYRDEIRKTQAQTQSLLKTINEKMGVTESNMGLAHPSLWDPAADRSAQMKEKPLIVAKVNKIFQTRDKPGENVYQVSVKQSTKYVVEVGDKDLDASDLKEGDRVALDTGETHSIQLILPSKIDPTVSLMEVDEKPDVTYNDIGGYTEQLEKIRQVVELPLLHPEKFVKLGIEPPKGVLLYGPPGTGKTLCARAVANRTDATFICVIASELVQKYVGEGARLVREIFAMARTKKAAIIFIDEIDAIGGTRFDDGMGGDNEVQRTMMELINQLDGFDPRGNIKIVMATNRPDTLDPALVRPGRIDRKVEFGLPNLEGRSQMFKINIAKMNVAKGIRVEMLARLCPNGTGAEIRSVCTEAGMIAIRNKRKTATEKDFCAAMKKVVNGYARFSATPKYLTHN